MSTTPRVILGAVLVWAGALAAAPRALAAQATSLPPRLGAPAREAIERLADSLRIVGGPASALYDKAAEGVLKGADDARIVAVVRTLARDLQEVRGALGPGSSPNDLVSAANALHAGIPLTALQRLRDRHGGAALALSCIVLADLAARGVPAAAAVTSVDALLADGAGDAELTAFRSGVERDLLAGRDPSAAVAARAQSAVRGRRPAPRGDAGRATRIPEPPPDPIAA